MEDAQAREGSVMLPDGFYGNPVMFSEVADSLLFRSALVFDEESNIKSTLNRGKHSS